MTQSDNTLGVDAATLLLEFDLQDTLGKVISGPDPKSAVNVVKVLGLVGSQEANELLQPLFQGANTAKSAWRRPLHSGGMLTVSECC